MRIALVSEGTYPFAMGGVSVWCDQLIRGMPQHDWEVVALSVDGSEKPLWERPANLTVVRTIPLWGPHTELTTAAPTPDMVRPFRDLVRTLLKPVEAHADQSIETRQRFLDALEDLYRVNEYQNVPRALTSPVALTVLMDEWNALYGDGLSLADALDVTLLLEHMLRPLFAPPVHADIVHASMNGLSMLVAMAAKWRHGSPVLMSEHGIYLRERYLSYVTERTPHAVKVLVLSFFRMLAGAGYLVADALAPHSSYNRRWQLQGGASPDHMWTMYNGVAPDMFPPVEAEPVVPTLAFMGRIDPIKDLHTLIRSFRLVQEQMPDARLRIFGGASAENVDYLTGCVELVDQLDLTSSVTFEGRVDTPAEAYHAASVVVLSSISEGFPYTVVEAMACQRTVVCTDVGGVKEAVADAGLVVPPRSPDAIAGACLQLLGDSGLRHQLAMRARRRVLEHFTLQRSLDAYAQLYERLYAGRRQEADPVAAGRIDFAGWRDIVDRLSAPARSGGPA